MDTLELRVKVEKSQLDALERQVEGLRKSPIIVDVQVNKGQLRGVRRTLTGIKNKTATVDIKVNRGQMDRLKKDMDSLRRGKKITLDTSGVTQGAKEASRSVKDLNRTTNLLGDSVGKVAAKMAVWQVMGDLVATPIRALKEAVSTMKDVDSEMVNIQKVTDLTGTEMSKLTDRAYEMASQYGRTATEVSQAMTAFARAGYGDQLESMADMSTLLQNIGDISADTANSMLLAVDAAWGLNGSQTALMSVMDGANEITNRNATDMSKLAEGATVAASVFAESGESIQSFYSMLGTGTAVTQRSGSEIARGLRTIMMNIRQIRGETEDGELIDGESIAKASSALKEFADISTMTADGELKKASDVLDELADKWDNLDSVAQSAIAEALAGKRQANILTSLMANWDMYEKQMREYAQGVGSALKENEIYMDSWEAKSKQLASAWTEFVSGLVSTDVVKGGLDGLTGFVELLDSDFGHAAIEVAALATAFTGLSKAANLLKGSKIASFLGDIPNFANAFSFIAKQQGTMKALGQTVSMVGSTLLKSPVAWAAAIMGVVEVVDLLTTTFEEQGEKVQELQGQYDELNKAGGRLEALRKQDAGGDLTRREQAELTILQAQSNELERQLKLAKEKAVQLWQNDYGSGEIVSYGDIRERDNYRESTKDVLVTQKLADAQKELNGAFMDGLMSEEDYRSGLEGIIANSKDYYDSLLGIKDAGFEVSDAQKEFIQQYEQMADRLGNTKDGMMEARLIFEDFSKLWGDSGPGPEFGKTAVNVDALREALESAGATAEDIKAVFDGMSQNDAIVEFSIEGDTDSAIESLKELGIAIEEEDGKTVTINYEDFTEFGRQIGLTRDQMTQFAINAESLGNINFSNAKGEIISIKEQLLGLGNTPINLNLPMQSLQNAGNEAEAVKGKFTDLGSTNAQPNIAVTGAEIAAQQASNVANAIKGIPLFTTATITIKQVGSVPSIGQNAKGNANFQGGLTLLGDEESPDGSPRPELVVTKGSAFVAGMDGPELRNLPRGARIFTYRDTKKILGQNSGTQASFPAFAKGTEKDAHLEGLEDKLGLLQAQYGFLEESGADAGKMTAKSREIQSQLHTINEYLRSIGGHEEEVVEYSTDWWKELKQIQETQREVYQDQRDLLESQVELMEHQGGQTKGRIDKLKEIQKSLHQEAQYLRSIGAEQAEINELSNQWWEVQEDILSVQQDLWDELDEAMSKELERAQEARDKELDALDERLKDMEAQRKEKEDQLTLEEKILAVQEAQDALLNAQNERTIRTYNAATGQWEWVAEQSSVEDAQEALEDAKKDLEDFQDDLAYEAAVAEIEARKNAINDAYDALEEGWEDIVESVQEPTRSISEILRDIAENGTPLMKAQVETTGQLLSNLNNYIASAISSTAGDSYTGGGGSPSKDYSKDTVDYSANMATAGDEAAFQYWAEQRNNKMEAQGIDPKAEGWKTNEEIYAEWKDKQNGGPSSSKSTSSGKSSSTSSSSSKSSTSSGSKTSWWSSAKKTTGKKVYDGGGVLKGLGGIKATPEDEMILPPEITKAMLSPSSNAVFQARMRELGLLYGGGGHTGALPAGGIQNNRSSQDHYGDVYQLGGVTLSEDKAKFTTVYELAQLSRNLSLHGWS